LLVHRKPREKNGQASYRSRNPIARLGSHTAPQLIAATPAAIVWPAMRFNPLDHPLAMLTPSYLSEVPRWIGHIPFAFGLIEMSEPRTVVELGAFLGDSYFAFCQAVAALDLPTRCFAVDTWQGDPQTGYYGPEILARFRQRHDPLYAKFSTIMQSEFDAALQQFDDGSIDILHIDGTHTYSSVKHDFDSWLPKMSDAGVVLFHDTAIRSEGYEVWKLWEELAPRFPSFRFDHSFGLGVLGVGENLSPPVRSFFESVNGDDAFKREEADVVRAYFNHLGTNIARMRALSNVISQLQRQRAMIDQWKQRSGQLVEPADASAAFADPMRYAAHLTRDLQLLTGPRT